jgi:hypothetical protein
MSGAIGCIDVVPSEGELLPSSREFVCVRVCGHTAFRLVHAAKVVGQFSVTTTRCFLENPINFMKMVETSWESGDAPASELSEQEGRNFGGKCPFLWFANSCWIVSRIFDVKR